MAEVVASRQAVRAAARRRRGRRGAAISAISTVVVIGGLIAIIVTSPGWDDVKQTFFSWPDFKRSFPEVLKGFWLDVKLFCIVEVVVLVAGPGDRPRADLAHRSAVPRCACWPSSTPTCCVACRRSCSCS